MIKEQIRVRDWMTRFGQETHNNNPTIPSLEIRKLRAKLILEEALETIKGLGFKVVASDSTDKSLTLQSWQVINSELSGNQIPMTIEPSLNLIADGIADSLVVLLGTAVACGIDIEPVFDEVMRSNDSKLWTSEEVCNELHVTSLEAKQYRTDSLTFNWISGAEKGWLVKDNNGKVIKSISYEPAKIIL